MISRLEVVVTVDQNEFIADVTADNLGPTDRFAYYLLKDDAIVWRSGYGHDSRLRRTLTEEGTYSVKAFVKRGEYKRSSTSDHYFVQVSATDTDDSVVPQVPPCAYDTADSLSSAARHDERLPSLPFYSLKYPHHDFCVVSDLRDGRRSAALALDASAQRRGLRVDEWRAQCGETMQIVSSRGLKEARQSAYVFSGTTRTSDRLVFGSDDLTAETLGDVSDQVGDYTLLRLHEGGATITTDYFGVSKLYYYAEGAVACVSNRYHLLLLTLEALGVCLDIAADKAAANLCAVNQVFTQNFSREMEVAGCFCLPVGSALEIVHGSASVSASALSEVLAGGHKDIDDQEYEELVLSARSEIISNLEVALEHPKFDAIRVDVTGGMDARMVFAALSNLSRHSEKVYIHTADVAASPRDLELSLQLTAARHYPYDSIPRSMRTVSLEESLLDGTSVHLGAYYGWKPKAHRVDLRNTLRINGFYGEICARPYYARLLFGKKMEKLPVADFASRYVGSMSPSVRPIAVAETLERLFGEELSKLPGSSVLEKFDHHYLFYRNGLHCTDKWLNESLAPAWGPLQSKSLFRLKHATFHAFEGIKVQLDVTTALNADLASLPYGRDQDNRDREALAPHLLRHAEPSSVTTVEDSSYREAAKARSRNTTREPVAGASEIARSNRDFDDRLRKLSVLALQHVVEDGRILTDSQADNLYDFLRTSPSATTSTAAHSVLSNKLISLAYQLELCRRQEFSAMDPDMDRPADIPDEHLEQPVVAHAERSHEGAEVLDVDNAEPTHPGLFIVGCTGNCRCATFLGEPHRDPSGPSTDRTPCSVMEALRQSPKIAYENLATSPEPPQTALREELDRLLSAGWKLGRNHIDLRPPITWKHDNRSFDFHLHAWDPVSLLIAGYERLGERRCLDAALAICDDWLGVYQAPLLVGDRDAALESAEGYNETMAWYDMGTGQRAYRLAYLTDVVGRDERADQERFAKLFHAVRFHVQLLSRDSFFADHSNHGLYQALGLLAAARRFRFLPEFERAYQLGLDRLDLMFARSFFDSGVHREHSPGYHLMIFNTLLGARSAALLSKETDERMELAEAALGWMIGPRGALATFGDTDYNELYMRSEQLTHLRNPGVMYSMSRGQVGEPPRSGLKAYMDAGVVFVRNRDHGTYLAHAAAFHSRTHKHADDFTFLWWEGDEEVLIDPGRFGYLEKTLPGSEQHAEGFWYADPRRIYVEKTRAHNCVEIDGQDYPRRKVAPFGSALIQAEEQGDLYVTGAETRHFGRVRHRRNLVLRPGHFLLALDWLQDTSQRKHTFRQWFQFGQQWGQVDANEFGARFKSSSSGRRLWVSNLLSSALPTSYRGQTKPYMSGWRSDKAESLIPATSLNFSDSGSVGTFATLILLGQGQPAAGTRANQTLRQGRFCWSQGDELCSVRTSWVNDRLHAVFTSVAQ